MKRHWICGKNTEGINVGMEASACACARLHVNMLCTNVADSESKGGLTGTGSTRVISCRFCAAVVKLCYQAGASCCCTLASATTPSLETVWEDCIFSAC